MGGMKYCMFDNQDIEYIQNLLFCLIDSDRLREYREFKKNLLEVQQAIVSYCLMHEGGTVTWGN